MPNRDPFQWDKETVTMAIGMALFGALINWATKMRSFKKYPSLELFMLGSFELMYDLLVGGFLGLLTILISYKLGLDIATMGILCGAFGHAGPRILYIIRRYTVKKTGEYLDETDKGETMGILATILLQPSTWRGVIMILTAVGVLNADDAQTAINILSSGVAGSGALGLLPDQLKKGS